MMIRSVRPTKTTVKMWKKGSEKIALQVPLSETKRPGWDVKVLEALGAAQIQVNEDIWQQVWSEEEKLNYGSTPMFMVEAVK